MPRPSDLPVASREQSDERDVQALAGVPIRTEQTTWSHRIEGASKAAAAGTEESNEFDRLLARAAAEGKAAAEARKLVFEAHLKG